MGGDKQVFLWDVATARTLRRWAGHFGRVNCVGFGGEEGSVVVSGMNPRPESREDQRITFHDERSPIRSGHG